MKMVVKKLNFYWVSTENIKKSIYFSRIPPDRNIPHLPLCKFFLFMEIVIPVCCHRVSIVVLWGHCESEICQFPIWNKVCILFTSLKNRIGFVLLSVSSGIFLKKFFGHFT